MGWGLKKILMNKKCKYFFEHKWFSCKGERGEREREKEGEK